MEHISIHAFVEKIYLDYLQEIQSGNIFGNKFWEYTIQVTAMEISEVEEEYEHLKKFQIFDHEKVDFPASKLIFNLLSNVWRYF